MRSSIQKKGAFPRKTLLSLSIAAMVGVSGVAFAGAFQLFEANGVNAGDAAAGSGTIVDASAAYFNPAGLTDIGHIQVLGALSYIGLHGKFDGSNSVSNPTFASVGPYTEYGHATTNAQAFVPAFDVSVPVGDRVALGLSVGAPFGLETDYGPSSIVRYSATQTKLVTADISPVVAFKFNKYFSVGAGFDALHAKVDFNSVAGLPWLQGNSDTTSVNTGKDWGYGWHGGFMLSPDDATRLSFTYRSPVKLNLKGTSTFTGPIAQAANESTSNVIVSNDLNAKIKLPGTFIFGAYRQLNDRFAVMGTAYYTQWDVIKNITLNNVAAVDATFAPITNLTANSPTNYRNTWRVSVGGTMKLNDMWMMRAGVGYDQTPVNNTDRDIRLPDNNRMLAALGFHVQPTKTVGLDAGYMHLFLKKMNLDNVGTVGTNTTHTVGSMYSSVNIFGAQATVTV